jgi:hypothetical protein
MCLKQRLKQMSNLCNSVRESRRADQWAKWLMLSGSDWDWHVVYGGSSHAHKLFVDIQPHLHTEQCRPREQMETKH